jgi:hypothetical protein
MGLSVGFTATFASAASITGEVDFGQGFDKVMFDNTGTTQSVHFQIAPSIGGVAGTYRMAKYQVISGLSAPQTATVGTATSGSFVQVTALEGARFVKVVAPGGVGTTNTAIVCQFICSNY